MSSSRTICGFKWQKQLSPKLPTDEGFRSKGGRLESATSTLLRLITFFAALLFTIR